MNEELQKALVDILNSVLAAKDFLVAEVPDVIQQLLLWKAAYSAISMLGFFALVSLIIWINKKQIEYIKKQDYWELGDHPEVMANLFQIFWIIPLSTLWSLDWLMIWIAPKIFLLEYAAQLAK